MGPSALRNVFRAQPSSPNTDDGVSPVPLHFLADGVRSRFMASQTRRALADVQLGTCNWARATGGAVKPRPVSERIHGVEDGDEG